MERGLFCSCSAKHHFLKTDWTTDEKPISHTIQKIRIQFCYRINLLLENGGLLPPSWGGVAAASEGV